MGDTNDVEDVVTNVEDVVDATPDVNKPVEITDDVIKNHPLYKALESKAGKLLDETKARKGTIKELRGLLKAYEGDDGDDADAAKPKTPAVTPVDEASLIKKLKAELKREADAERAADAQHEVDVNNLITKHGLPATAKAILSPIRDANVLKTVAEQLAKANLQFDNVSGGGAVTNVDDLVAKVKARLGQAGK